MMTALREKIFTPSGVASSSRTGFPFLLLGLLTVLSAPIVSAYAAPARWHPVDRRMVRPAGTGPSLVIDGRIVEVRRLSREISVRAGQATIQQIKIRPDTRVRAPGTTRFDALRSGAVIHLVVVKDPHGAFIARSVSLR